MTPDEFLQWEKKAPGVDFKSTYVDVAGDLLAGVLLSQVIFYHLPQGKREHKLNASYKGQLWIAKTKEQWFREIRFTEKRFDRALDILIAGNLVFMVRAKHRGNPTLFIRLNVEVFLLRLDEVVNHPTLFSSETTKKAFSKRPKRQNENLPFGGFFPNEEFFKEFLRRSSDNNNRGERLSHENLAGL